jgi:hypothetical protein
MPEETATPEGLTREKVLKRTAIGAAGLWAAPMFLTTSSALGADIDNVRPVRCVERALARGDESPCETCAEGLITGDCSANPNCVCFVSANGCCHCADVGGVSCGGLQGCNTNGDCPRGFKCDFTCCDGGGTAPGKRCLRTCGGRASAGTIGLDIVRA